MSYFVVLVKHRHVSRTRSKDHQATAGSKEKDRGRRSSQREHIQHHTSWHNGALLKAASSLCSPRTGQTGGGVFASGNVVGGYISNVDGEIVCRRSSTQR